MDCSKILAGETSSNVEPDKLPQKAATDRQKLSSLRTQIQRGRADKVGGAMIGRISFASLRRERSWASDIVHRFQAIGEIFGFGLDRKRVVAETLRLRNELNHISRVKTTGGLAASMVHELNQPLGATLNNAEALQIMLASERPDLEEVRAGISDIIEDSFRARETIQRLWALFRLGGVVKSNFDYDELLERNRSNSTE